MHPVTGAVLAGRYRLERLLGEGGMGAVWAATHTLTRKTVAIKLLNEQNAKDVRTRQRFMREARAASAVRHPNVVEIHDVSELEDGTPILIMELLEGESLGQKLDRERTIALPELARIMLPVISAVGAAHMVGIVHRDLKPDNIFLSREQGALVVKVLDFGIAKLTAIEGDAAATGGLTGTGAMLGTPYYMSPEQVFGEKNIDHRADIWALGIILYEALSGVRPTQGENIGQILKVVTTGKIAPLATTAPHLPMDVTTVVDRMLVKDPEARLSDLREVLGALRRYGDIAVLSFDEPTYPRRAAASIPPESAAAFERTVEQGPQQPKTAPDAVTLGPTTAHTSGAMPRKKWPVIVGAVSVLAIAAGVILAVTSRHAPPPEVAATPIPSAAPTPQPTPHESVTAAPSIAVEPTVVASHSAQVVKTAAPKPTAKATPSTTATATSQGNTGGVVDKPPF